MSCLMTTCAYKLLVFIVLINEQSNMNTDFNECLNSKIGQERHILTLNSLNAFVFLAETFDQFVVLLYFERRS